MKGFNYRAGYTSQRVVSTVYLTIILPYIHSTQILCSVPKRDSASCPQDGNGYLESTRRKVILKRYV
jgi:hypothetical protein